MSGFKYGVRALHQQAFDFKGRTSRADFWWGYLYLIIISAVFGFLFGMFSGVLTSMGVVENGGIHVAAGSVMLAQTKVAGAATTLSVSMQTALIVQLIMSLIYLIWIVLLSLLGIGLAIRRLHDLNRSGWWYLLYLSLIGILVLLYWYCQPGDKTNNRFGEPSGSKSDQ